MFRVLSAGIKAFFDFLIDFRFLARSFCNWLLFRVLLAMSRSGTAACQTPQTSLRPTTKESFKTNILLPPQNAIAG